MLPLKDAYVPIPFSCWQRTLTLSNYLILGVIKHLSDISTTDIMQRKLNANNKSMPSLRTVKYTRSVRYFYILSIAAFKLLFQLDGCMDHGAEICWISSD